MTTDSWLRAEYHYVIYLRQNELLSVALHNYSKSSGFNRQNRTVLAITYLTALINGIILTSNNKIIQPQYGDQR